MSKDEILNILPTPEGDEFAKVKEGNPYNIMLNFANAIDEKYTGKISASITSSTSVSSDNSETRLSYSFYIKAPIGRGYFYRLFEVKPVKETPIPYPVEVNLFEKGIRNLGKASTAEELNNMLLSIFKSGFVFTLIQNLLVQVDLYNENRNKK